MKRICGAFAVAMLFAGCADSEPGRSPAGAAVPAAPAAKQPAPAPAAAEIVAAQMPYYSISQCLACGLALDAAGGAQDVVHAGKLLRVCSDACRAKLLESPGLFVAARDSALVAAQLASYPTDSCIVMVDTLHLFDTPRNVIYGARLVRLCCETCEEQFLEEPAKFLAVLDARMRDPNASLVPPATSPN